MRTEEPAVGTAGGTLGNGLRVRVAPVPSVTAVGIALHYGVGFRSDPEHLSGLAHLFEHLMFQSGEAGSDHFVRIESLGGFCNASTRQDYTDYYSIVPSELLDEVLAMEAARVREPVITEKGIRAELGVVREEIESKGKNPYGRFPWPLISPLMFDTFANAHDGFGDPAALEAVSLDDCLTFRERFYTPANAVLTISGDIDPAHAVELAERHFGQLPTTPAPPPPRTGEPGPDGLVTGTVHDPYAAHPAFAVGYRVPDPALDPTTHFGLAMIAELLTGGPAPLVEQRLRARTGKSASVSSHSGLFDFMDARDPDLWIFSTVHPPEVDPALLLDLLDSEIHRIAEEGPGEDDLARARARRLASFHRKTDSLASLTRVVGKGALLFGDDDLPHTIRRGFAEITTEQISEAAKWLTRDGRALLTVLPEGKAHT